MPALLAAIQDQIDQTRMIVTFALILVRVMVIVTLVPYMGGKNAPNTVKMGIGATLTIVLWPTVVAHLSGPVPVTPAPFVLMMLKEAFVGLLIGYVSAEIFYTVEMAGQHIDLLRGANQAQLNVPQITERSSTFGSLNYQLLIALFVATDLHHVFINALFESFVAVPINTWPELSQGFPTLLDFVLKLMSHIFLVSVLLALPVGITCLVIEASFGLMNRVAPQINAYFMAMPAKAIGGVTIFFFSLHLVIELFIKHSAEMLRAVQDLLILLQ